MSDSSESDDLRAGDITSWQAINTSRSTRNAIVVEDEQQVSNADHDKDRDNSATFVDDDDDDDDVRVQVEPPEGFDPNEFEDFTHSAEVVAEVRSQSAGLYTVAFEDGHVNKVRDGLSTFSFSRLVWQ